MTVLCFPSSPHQRRSCFAIGRRPHSICMSWPFLLKDISPSIRPSAPTRYTRRTTPLSSSFSTPSCLPSTYAYSTYGLPLRKRRRTPCRLPRRNSAVSSIEPSADEYDVDSPSFSPFTYCSRRVVLPVAESLHEYSPVKSCGRGK